MGLQAGTAKVNITPPVGTMLSGYAARNHGAVAINDQLWARVLYLNDGATEIVLVTLEVLMLPEECATAIRSRAAELTSVPEEDIMISGTHTHSGPVIARGADSINGRYVAYMEDAVVGAIVWAKNSRVENVAVSYQQAAVQCGVNRRELRGGRMVLGVNPEGPVYPYVDVLRICSPNGELLAAWFCHPCHAVVLGQTNYVISGDYAGAACRFVEANCAGIAMFANGFAGNINAQYHNSGFAEVELVGRRLGSAVIQALAQNNPLQNIATEPQLISRQHSFYLPTDPLPTMTEVAATVRNLQNEAVPGTGSPKALRDAEWQLSMVEASAEYLGLPVTIQVMAIGNLGIVAVPGEVFVEIATEIQAQSPFPVTIPVGYANGSIGYVPVSSAFALGGYEVEKARASHHGLRITPDAGEVLVRECLHALHSVWDARHVVCGGEGEASL